METRYFSLIGLAFILTHEMDAIRSREWTMFPLLSRLDDKVGYLVFTALHIPIYLIVFWGLYSANEPNRSLIFGLDIFFIVHVFLHLLLLKHPKNQFTSVFSWAIILGSGVAGLLDLVLCYFY